MAPTIDPGVIVGSTFRVLAATHNGQGLPLVPDTRPWIRFTTDRRFVAYAGCNAINGDYELREGRLITHDVGVTLSICGDVQVMHQEGWYVIFLQSGPAIGWESTSLVLTSGETVVTLEGEDG